MPPKKTAAAAATSERALRQLRELSAELGHPGAQPLWLAAKRKGLEVQRKDVLAWVAGHSEKQVLAAPQRAAGKSISEDDNRWQMDLVDVTSISGEDSRRHRFFLVCANVFDRFLYARALMSKEPAEVASMLRQILDENTGALEGRSRLRAATRRKKPSIISSDNGAEFGGEVAALLKDRGIEQRFKDPGDLNALGLLDRQIGLLKKKLAEMAARTKRTWPFLLQQAVDSLNATPKPDVLHGEAPKDVKDSPAVRFMLQQDQARALNHNQRLTDRRKAQLEESGGHFRPQLAIGKFKRNFQATYGDTQKAVQVQMGRVGTKTGATFPLKQIKIVPAKQKK